MAGTEGSDGHATRLASGTDRLGTVPGGNERSNSHGREEVAYGAVPGARPTPIAWLYGRADR
jgi:hypothetical protein